MRPIKKRSANVSTYSIKCYLLRSSFGKYIPKSQCFISSSSDNRFAIRAHGQIQNSIMMSGQFSYLYNHKLIISENVNLFQNVNTYIIHLTL